MISDGDILERVWSRTRKRYETLDQARAEAPSVVWDGLFDLASYARLWTPEDIKSRIEDPMAEAPLSALFVLMQLVVKAQDNYEDLLEKLLYFAGRYPAEGLKAMASILKLGPKYPHDLKLVRFAQEHYDLEPEEAWWVFLYVSRLGPRLLDQELLEWLAARHKDGGRHWFEILAGCMPESEWAAARYLETFAENPADAIESAGHCLTGLPVLPLVKEHFAANPERAWEFFRDTAREETENFPLEDLDFLETRIEETADPMFEILGFLAARADINAMCVERFARLIGEYPEEGINRAYYVFVNNPQYLNKDILDTVCAHFKDGAYHAFDILGAALAGRGDLVRRAHVDQAFEAIPLAANWAFAFFTRLMKARPNEARVCVMALFECLGCEPPNRANNRSEMVRELAGIASASHITTALSQLLQQPPAIGSRRSRGLMAILFRQQLHAKQAVMIDALRLAATACTRNDMGRTPLWDFLGLLLDESGKDAVSTAAAEQFLEAFYQLSFLSETGAEYDEMVSNFDVLQADPGEWPEDFGILNRDEELCRLYGIVGELARRHGRELELRPLDDFANRAAQAEQEISFLEKKKDTNKQIEKRIANLKAAIAEWSRPEIKALMKGEAPGLEPEALKQHRRVVRRLKKDLTNHLRAALRKLTVETIHRARKELYASRLKAILGKEPPMDRIDPTVLPALLFFPALGGFPNNYEYLARLVEDRIKGREPDWLWTEPAPAAWAEEMKKAVPGIKLKNWRSRFEKTYTYRPEDAAAGKKRRIKADLTQTRDLLIEAGAGDVSGSDPDELEAILEKLLVPPAEEDEEWKAPPPDLVQEIRMNLERLRNLIGSSESDYEGVLKFEVETDPFGILFMGEYGFASCLSLRGSNAWSAVSNAIDIDKTIIWARDPGGNVVGRRLLALTPGGLLSYRTYTNQHGMALNPMFRKFIRALAEHVGVRVTGRGNPKALLSDRWYNDGAV